MAQMPAENFPTSTGTISEGWKLAVNDRWSPNRNAQHTANAMQMTLSRARKSRTMDSRASTLAEPAKRPAVASEDSPNTPPIFANGFAKYLRIRYTIGNAPHSIMPIAPEVSSARNMSSSSAMIGSKPKDPNNVDQSPVKYSTTTSTNTIFSAASIARPNTIKPRIIASGANLSPAASATQMMMSGMRFTPICAHERANWQVASALVETTSRTTGWDSAIMALATNTPMGMANRPLITPSARYLRSRFSSIFSATGMVNTMVAPAIYPVIMAMIQLSRVCARASASWYPPMSTAMNVVAAIAGSAPSAL